MGINVQYLNFMHLIKSNPQHRYIAMDSIANNVVLFILNVTVFISAVRSDLMMEMVQKHNVLIEKHTVITPDGYILGLYHIPPKNKANENTKVIFLINALFTTSAQHVIYRGDSPGFFFHDNGYDVWLGNGRGAPFSRNHTNLDPAKVEFWKFSLNEIGAVDMPAMIDYILENTKMEKVVCLGNSQGATSVLILLSERPEFNDKVSSIHLIAVSAITKSSLRQFELVSKLRNFLGFTDTNCTFEPPYYIGSTKTFSFVTFCANPIRNNVCREIFETTGGPFTNNSFTKNLMSDIANAGLPVGGSCEQVLHYIQCFNAGSFRKYDYGAVENLKLYGSEQPPSYNFSNIRTNVHLIYGTNDNIATASDELYLIENMRNAKQIRKDTMKINHYECILPPHAKLVMEIIDEAVKWFEH